MSYRDDDCNENGEMNSEDPGNEYISGTIEEDGTFFIVNEDGDKRECRAVCSFYNEEAGKNYLFYYEKNGEDGDMDDDGMDDDGIIRVAVFNPKEKNSKILPVENEEELKAVREKLREIRRRNVRGVIEDMDRSRKEAKRLFSQGAFDGDRVESTGKNGESIAISYPVLEKIKLSVLRRQLGKIVTSLNMGIISEENDFNPEAKEPLNTDRCDTPFGNAEKWDLIESLLGEITCDIENHRTDDAKEKIKRVYGALEMAEAGITGLWRSGRYGNVPVGTDRIWNRIYYRLFDIEKLISLERLRILEQKIGENEENDGSGDAGCDGSGYDY